MAARAAPLGGRHDLVQVSVDGLDELLRACPVPLSSMGRGLDADPACFLASAAACGHAGRLADPGPGHEHYDLERSAVRVVLRDAGGRILLFRAVLASRSDAVWWELPGGGLDPGETYLEAAIREIAGGDRTWSSARTRSARRAGGARRPGRRRASAVSSMRWWSRPRWPGTGPGSPAPARPPRS